MLLACVLVFIKVLHLFAVHVLHDVVCLPFLEAETNALMTIVLVVGLVLVVLDLNEIRIDRVRIERERDYGIDRGGLWDDFECP